MTASKELLLAQLAQLIRTAPPFTSGEELGPDDLRWLAQSAAALEKAQAVHALVDFRTERDKLNGPYFHRTRLMMPLHDAYALMELSTPSAQHDAFIPPGDAFGGFAALVRVVGLARRSLLLVDPYVNASLFTEIAPVVPEGVELRCLTSKQNENELTAVFAKWQNTGGQAARPVQVRFAPPKTLHDRWIIVDGARIWNVTQTFKDIAARSAASVTEDRTDLAGAKIEYWESAWETGELLIPGTILP